MPKYIVITPLIFVQAATADIRMAVATATVAPEVALAVDTGSSLQWPQQPSQPPLFTPTNRTRTKSMFRIAQPLLSVSHRCIERARGNAGHRSQSPDSWIFVSFKKPAGLVNNLKFELMIKGAEFVLKVVLLLSDLRCGCVPRQSGE
jgi:hypothetical protein